VYRRTQRGDSRTSQAGRSCSPLEHGGRTRMRRSPPSAARTESIAAVVDSTASSPVEREKVILAPSGVHAGSVSDTPVGGAVSQRARSAQVPGDERGRSDRIRDAGIPGREPARLPDRGQPACLRELTRKPRSTGPGTYRPWYPASAGYQGSSRGGLADAFARSRRVRLAKAGPSLRLDSERRHSGTLSQARSRRVVALQDRFARQTSGNTSRQRRRSGTGCLDAGTRP
jgi:hypothetical protein